MEHIAKPQRIVSDTSVIASEITRLQSSKTNLVIIDPRVDNVQELATGVEKGTEVFILEPNSDGMTQVTQLLLKYNDIASLHLVSHGSPGNLQLGNTNLSLCNLENYTNQWSIWFNRLQKASLLLYGCEVALGNIGSQFVQKLHQLTGANLAASTQRVGNNAKGGTWDLEYKIGQVTEKLAFLPKITATYSGVFRPTVSVTASPTSLVESQGTVTTITIRLNQAAPSGGLIVKLDSTKANALGDFDVFGGTLSGARLVRVNSDSSGVDLRVTAQTATIRLPVFNDDDRPSSDPNRTRNDDIGRETTTFSLLSSPDYLINSSARSITFTIVDNTSQLSQPLSTGTYGDDILIRGGSVNTTRKAGVEIADLTLGEGDGLKALGVTQLENNASVLANALDSTILAIVPESTFL
ncbi:DUF4347 domain-containing protein [Gloeocapsa sp. PCC 73106]|uniref:DUF4347 domain-containing protein n=1 Tax=Gloeocapsa sp. PCC 73106 TaxID=102232 RepID=UPI0002AC3055|nr:DUF4347 domain-containing protein [Gloeocapsa sp. PCC 73106]ELR99535.1 hypothetical protein GLO73106DRAFT_00033870 [Gloeocapsa sp. PCC 73106]